MIRATLLVHVVDATPVLGATVLNLYCQVLGVC